MRKTCVSVFGCWMVYG